MDSRESKTRQVFGEERAAVDPKRSSPDQHETLDKTAVLTALAVLGLGMMFLAAMLFLLFPEWIRPRAFATESSTPPISIVTLRPPAPFEEGQVAPGTMSPVRRPVSQGTPAVREPARALSERTRPIAAADATRNLRTAEMTDAALLVVSTSLPSSPLPDLGLTVEPLPSVVSVVKQIITGTIVAIGNGSLTVQTANGLVVVKVRDDTMILADGQLRSLRDVAVGQSVALLGDALDATGNSSGPVTIDRTPKDTPSGSGTGVGIEVKGVGIGVKVP